jgi:hypothetical protein
MQITAFIFAGNIPAELCQLSNLRLIYLSHTGLAMSSDSSDCNLNEGNIPAELCQLSMGGIIPSFTT